MKKIRGLRISISVMVLLLTGVTLYLSLNPHWIKIETVSLELMPGSAEFLLFQRIRTSLMPQLEKFSGKYFWSVPLSQVYEVGIKDKRVKRVSVYREFPSRLKVEIEPQTPRLSYLSSDNRLYPIATDATLLPALGLSEVSDLPIVRGENLRDEPALRESALDLFEQIPSEGSLRKKNVSEIFYTKKDGFKIYIASPAVEIKMGDADFGPKISRVEKVLSYLDSQNIKGRVIDARFDKKVVVRVRKGP